MAISSSIGQDLLNVPMGDMIREMAFAIAEAQIKLDENSIEVAEMMGGLKTIEDDNGNIIFEDSRVFFGTEKVLLTSAIALHNTTSDVDLKGQLAALLTANSKVEVVPSSSPTEYQLISGETDEEISIPVRLSMLELGFTPTFYQFVDTIIEVRIGISFSRETSSEVKVDTKSKSVTKSKTLSFSRGKFSRTKNRTVTTTQVNATYASKYNYSAEGSSLLRTKLAPVPPPPVLEDRIRQLLEEEQAVAPATTPAP
ncbi:MAG: hypothetical protein MI810_25210 [Flavobacteriales bacterium]|nr:hypothetical protein [Flavobacteriales bacterium]